MVSIEESCTTGSEQEPVDWARRQWNVSSSNVSNCQQWAADKPLSQEEEASLYSLQLFELQRDWEKLTERSEVAHNFSEVNRRNDAVLTALQVSYYGNSFNLVRLLVTSISLFFSLFLYFLIEGNILYNVGYRVTPEVRNGEQNTAEMYSTISLTMSRMRWIEAEHTSELRWWVGEGRRNRNAATMNSHNDRCLVWVGITATMNTD